MHTYITWHTCMHYIHCITLRDTHDTTYIHACIKTYRHTLNKFIKLHYIHAYMHCIHTRIHTLKTHIHTYMPCMIQTYIHYIHYNTLHAYITYTHYITYITCITYTHTYITYMQSLHYMHTRPSCVHAYTHAWHM